VAVFRAFNTAPLNQWNLASCTTVPSDLRAFIFPAPFDGGQVKGSTALFIELVKIDGTTARFGPVDF
jgi:hypothetical protein